MKKKLTKEQLQERKARLEKSFHILLYISLAFNILFIALGVYGCSTMPKKQLDQVQQPNKQLRQERNYASGEDFEIFNNSSVTCFDLNDFNYTPVGRRWSGGQVILPTNENIMLFGGASYEDYSGINKVMFSIDIHDTPQQGDLVQIYGYHNDDLLGQITWAYTPYESVTRNGWTKQSFGTVNSGWYLAVNTKYVGYNTGVNIYVFFEGLFSVVDYKDFSLPNNWNIFNRYPLRSATGGYVNVINKILFSVNGRLYDTIRLFYGASGNRIWFTDDINNDGEISQMHELEMVTFYNSSSGDNKIVYLYRVVYNNEGKGGWLYGQYDQLDLSLFNIRLFGINLVQGNTSVMDIFNYSSDTYYGNLSNNYGDGQFGNVFNLFTSAFNGLTGLLSIQILPNITIGILVFLPLIGLIIFAILRLVKK